MSMHFFSLHQFYFYQHIVKMKVIDSDTEEMWEVSGYFRHQVWLLMG